MLLFRLTSSARQTQGPLAKVSRPLEPVYRLYASIMLGVELNPGTQIGPRLQILHGQGLVVHVGSIVGADCILRQNTTLGVRRTGGGAPILGNSVDVGSGAQIIGDVTIGDRTSVGAGAVVVRSCSAGEVLVGNPARPVGSVEVAPKPKPRS